MKNKINTKMKKATTIENNNQKHKWGVCLLHEGGTNMIWLKMFCSPIWVLPDRQSAEVAA